MQSWVALMRFLAYLRVSKADKLRGERLGLKAQRALTTAERNGWDIVGWYEDDGVSGKSTDRPGLQPALAALRLGRRGWRRASSPPNSTGCRGRSATLETGSTCRTGNAEPSPSPSPSPSPTSTSTSTPAPRRVG
ncbi:hypothetical protein C5C45_09340 [Rathayibacter rathayi]|uniref:recombinase family protein n=2 Tax=Rathayibacter rathayi TaxID=33887 RepID=UPI000BE457A0|nr:recombinase family protein [Rathayibacter rathayi]AZZ48193.1 hypothetical protein C1O28_02400 [Rathayibacter rathayi]PPF23549.1 hypothetical protein C5C34_08165 [Rathayibacter rathayi]PPF48364.1 hypothetical protein C5C08_09290 [Rathayibacter rathayi]PPF82102.1 hypothetical protein C5C14_03985 [Rathayibacter rathayi]PPG14779.1 hypothetical protein C5C11_03935 [Rathayibacter rathayi]